MTRQWADDRLTESKTRPAWVMVCDQKGCTTTSEEFPTQPDLEIFAGRGWFIAQKYGDICPACLAKGVRPTVEPHRVAIQGVRP